MDDAVLTMSGVEIGFRGARGMTRVVHGVDLDIRPGEIHAVVGESGSGKTMLAKATMGLLPPGGEVMAGGIRFGGRDLATLDAREMRRIRGAEIGMIFQEPLVSLNPSLKIGTQMAEAMRLHTDLSSRQIRARAIEMLEAVKIPDPEACLDRYPHAFSGGMRQRIMIASVLMLGPRLLLADEPTTALDAVVQREVLDIMTGMTRKLGVAVMLVTHDLGVVARYAQRMTVMERGHVVEHGETAAILAAPREAYTRRLLASLPAPPAADAPVAAADATPPLLEAEAVEVSYERPAFMPFAPPVRTRVVHGVSLSIRPGEMLGLVGESGSGKSTLGRALIRLMEPSGGRVLYRGRDLSEARGEELRHLRSRMQIVFQDPFSSLNPRMRVGQIVAEGLRHLPPGAPRSEIPEMLEAVGLGPEYAERFPHEMSGGQRQRVAIARALVSQPELVVADEPVSALDVTVQAQILDLLRDLKARMGFACLFISHDLSVVESLCDRVIVLYRGEVQEEGPARQLFEAPRHDYTRRLLAAAPFLERTASGGYALRTQELPG